LSVLISGHPIAFVGDNEDDSQFVFLSVNVSFTRPVGSPNLLPLAATYLARLSSA